jgi:hypothetical protein
MNNKFYGINIRAEDILLSPAEQMNKNLSLVQEIFDFT